MSEEITQGQWQDLHMRLGAQDDKIALLTAELGGLKVQLAEAVRLTAERDRLKAQLAKAMHVVKGWAEWHRLVENDLADDLSYLNGKAWDDAEALADNAQTFLRSISKEEQR